ncbi:Dihydroxyacetone kinase [Quillaja saponaria]|uniref:Dihydroxyacetone kinase n=1 Tax=Quillaja saponaria TaxID=32244 RepID=A0AAD7Q5I4_QUISA|nr:Dihydroxyacetone kinase [Quillaja saponaria]
MCHVQSMIKLQIAIISGGGSVKKSTHAGFVGEGMLTAAIFGGIFASPPVDSILANYTSDGLNFGLAAEQAKPEEFEYFNNVQTVIVGDDCVLPPPRGIAGRRGLAGTVLIHKVAGAAEPYLHDVAAEAKRASEVVGTMGVALTVCTLPGQVTSDRLGQGKMEVDFGILHTFNLFIIVLPSWGTWCCRGRASACPCGGFSCS